MSRIWLTVILPLALPTILYVLWGLMAAPGSRRSGVTQTWPWLLVAGIALSAFVLVAAWLRTGSGGNGTYEPPHITDGKVVPGQLVPPGTPPR
jgi:Family of unknown function (DUF6111)